MIKRRGGTGIFQIPRRTAVVDWGAWYLWALQICKFPKKSSRPGRNNKINVNCVGWHKRANHRSAQLRASLNGPAKKQKGNGERTTARLSHRLLGTQLARDRAIGFTTYITHASVCIRGFVKEWKCERLEIESTYYMLKTITPAAKCSFTRGVLSSKQPQT